MKTKINKRRNFVAKHAKRSGSGFHVLKNGKRSPRHIQKRAFEREILRLI